MQADSADHATCVARCPPGKSCTVADDNEGCLVGETIPGEPTCCEADATFEFLNTMYDMLNYSNQDHMNVQNLGYPNRERLYTFARSLILNVPMDMGALHWKGAPPWVPNGYEALDLPPSVHMPSRNVDDLLKAMAIRMPRDGFYARLNLSDIARQPRVMRENINLHFFTNRQLFELIPTNAATTAASLTLNVQGGPRSRHRVVSVIVNALSNNDPMSEADVSIQMTGALDPLINRGVLRMIASAMRPTGSRRFRGTIRLNGDSALGLSIIDPGALGVRQVAGKTLTANNDSLILTLP